MNRNALLIAMAVGVALQLAMVIFGHFAPAFRQVGFAVGGMGFSLIAGVIEARLARSGGWGTALMGGAIAGGVCAFVGIGVSAALGDVPPSLLILGSASSVVTGAIGGAIGKAIPRAGSVR
jgi:hypothetical protein